MKSCAESDSLSGCAAKRGALPRRSGFVLVYVLVVSVALVSLLALALGSVQKTAEENFAAARRIRLENVAAQASAIAEAWFYDNAAAIAEDAGFDTGTAPENDPTPDVPPGIFSPLCEQFPRYTVECICYDLHYPDSFAEIADAARIPYMPPFAVEDGGVVRAYYLRTSVAEAEDEKYKMSVTHSMRVKKSPSGAISVRNVGVTE